MNNNIYCFFVYSTLLWLNLITEISILCWGFLFVVGGIKNCAMHKMILIPKLLKYYKFQWIDISLNQISPIRLNVIHVQNIIILYTNVIYHISEFHLQVIVGSCLYAQRYFLLLHMQTKSGVLRILEVNIFLQTTSRLFITGQRKCLDQMLILLIEYL